MRLVPERGSLARWLGLTYGAIALAAVAAAGLGLPLATRPCFLLTRAGVACPTCGGTRCLAALWRGDPADALVQNPLVALGALLLVLWFLWAAAATLVPRWRRSLETSPAEARVLRIAAVGLALGTWVWEIVRHRG